MHMEQTKIYYVKKKKLIMMMMMLPKKPYGILIIAHSGLGKTTAFLNLTNHKMYTDKIYLYPKDPFEAKYQIAKYQSKQKTQHIVCI